MLSVSERTPIKVLIFSDNHKACYRHSAHRSISLTRYINQLASKIEKGHIVLDKPISIVHVGTNGINSMDAGAMLSSFNNLISQIREKKAALILLCLHFCQGQWIMVLWGRRLHVFT